MGRDCNCPMLKVVLPMVLHEGAADGKDNLERQSALQWSVVGL